VKADATAVRGSLAAAGRRLTRERSLLVEVISRHPHSDAARIYDLARAKLPRIGLATVYRTLRLLEEIGAIESQRLGEGHSHYEVADRDHLHVVCTECGALADVPLPVDLREIARQTGFAIERARFEAVGLCPRCAATRDR
jgi:Fur family ferric uptake transcriptional regulator